VNEPAIQRRIDRILCEIKRAPPQCDIQNWEFQRLNEWRTWFELSAKQEAILRKIEAKVFGEVEA
jgi:hypothetical protein